MPPIDPNRTQPAVAAVDMTAILAPPSDPSSDDSPRALRLAEGSSSGLSGEVCGVLRTRLRVAALLLAGGFFIFLVWHTLRGEFRTTLEMAMYATHTVVMLACAWLGFSLCRKCVHSEAKLRLMEAIIFGLPAAYFALMQYVVMAHELEKDHVLTRPLAPWYILMFTHALLVPNTWRKALPLMVVFTLVPSLVMVALWLSDPTAAELFAVDHRVLTETFLSSLVSLGVALIGVHSINQLRTDAYEARQIGQYRLKRLLGAGGMGEVYLAEHRLMKRPCAIKIIRPDKAGDPLTLARFEREVRATAKLSHWNTIDIYDYGRTEDGTFFYVMEYLPGMNLTELVQKFGPMPADRVVFLMRQVCDALMEAHQLELVHRDLKPANIFAAVRGGLYDVIKLLDFGLAKPMHNLEEGGLTQEGSITGSPLYMSPEQATGDREPDKRSDIYSLGAVMYYLLTGRPPFEYDKPLKVIIAHSHEAPRPIGELIENVPDDVQQIVCRCLEKNPEDRFQDAEHLAFALESCSVSRGWSRTRAAQWWTERCSGGVCYPEPPIASADLSMTHDSANMTKA
jgi:serine/threonine-protein kinase